MNKLSTISFLITAALALSNTANATSYTYELSLDKTWAEGGATSNTSDTVTVRSYVPGSNRTTYKNITEH